jgi:hypothetical protein
MMEEEPSILRNAIRTPDGTIIESKHRHDYVTHLDKNGEMYMVDGGLSYLRRSVNKEPAEDLTIYSDSPIEKIREGFSWGTYRKEGEDSLRYILLKDMSNSHIDNIIKDGYHKHLEEIFNRELSYREENQIYVED